LPPPITFSPPFYSHDVPPLSPHSSFCGQCKLRGKSHAPLPLLLFLPRYPLGKIPFLRPFSSSFSNLHPLYAKSPPASPFAPQRPPRLLNMSSFFACDFIFLRCRACLAPPNLLMLCHAVRRPNDSHSADAFARLYLPPHFTPTAPPGQFAPFLCLNYNRSPPIPLTLPLHRPPEHRPYFDILPPFIHCLFAS